ncbi:uncharacterized protein LOC106157207 [Lingula anatina]|uniref:Uncharacterized protein LOC106157207 n=1 Tax=Lingula anatina TaxID=7574 RepID=A0A1S3HQC8_LINAN|nr:uncharacterized protein LOC106157207 [Lingula anatina]XP_013388240.1 uncharacterized protein LOC106157207 [Lingula anatina]|eukprot:XP_013388239.1 uncharacterized protein LOC106157207 [Lingula anatina]
MSGEDVFPESPMWKENGSTCASDYEDKTRTSFDSLTPHETRASERLRRRPWVSSKKGKAIKTCAKVFGVVLLVLAGLYLYDFIFVCPLRSQEAKLYKEVAELKSRLFNSTVTPAIQKYAVVGTKDLSIEQERRILMGRYNASIKDLTQAHQKTKAQLVEHARQMEDFLNHLTDLSQSHGFTKAQLEEYKRLLNDSFNDLKSLMQDHELLVAEVERLGGKVNNNDNRTAEAFRKMDRLEQLMRQNFSSIRHSLNDASGRSRHRLDLLEAKLNQSKTDLQQDMSSKISALRGDLSQSGADVASIRSDIRELRGKYDRLDQSKKDLQQDMSSKISALRGDLSQSGADVASIRSDIRELRGKYDRLDRSKTDLRQEMYRKISALRGDLSQSKADVASLKSGIRELRGKYDRLARVSSGSTLLQASMTTLSLVFVAVIAPLFV